VGATAGWYARDAGINRGGCPGGGRVRETGGRAGGVWAVPLGSFTKITKKNTQIPRHITKEYSNKHSTLNGETGRCINGG